MSRRRRPQPPPRHPPAASKRAPTTRPDLLELDRFSKSDLERWNKRSKDLDELNALLYSGIEPQRQRHRDELIAALGSVQFQPLDFSGWVRMIPVRYANDPLSAAGSLKGYGGRFNVGADVDKSIEGPWPALYIASNQETAYREKFGLAKDDERDGLSGADLALAPGDSHAVFLINGHLELVFDIGKEGSLDAFCSVLRKIKLPREVRSLQRRLGLPNTSVRMVHSTSLLIEEALTPNWRGMPAQFGTPAVGQILAGMILAAGYEAIRYPSTKGIGECVAVFPHRLASEDSFIELADEGPPTLSHARLDLTSADELCCWDTLPQSARHAGRRKD